MQSEKTVSPRMSEQTINVIEPELMLEYALWGAAILLLCTYAFFMPLHLVALTFR